jgi:hypothetical protein
MRERERESLPLQSKPSTRVQDCHSVSSTTRICVLRNAYLVLRITSGTLSVGWHAIVDLPRDAYGYHKQADEGQST